jgi:hypothetical protein
MGERAAERRRELDGLVCARGEVSRLSGRIDVQDDDVVLRNPVCPMAVQLRPVAAFHRLIGVRALGARRHERQHGNADDDPDGANEIPVHALLLFRGTNPLSGNESRHPVEPWRTEPHDRGHVTTSPLRAPSRGLERLHVESCGVKTSRSSHLKQRPMADNKYQETTPEQTRKRCD